MIHSFRGGNVATLDVLDISAAINGVWTSNATYDGSPGSFNTGSSGKYAPFDNEGRFGYLTYYVTGAVNQLYRYDVKNRVMTPYHQPDLIISGTAAAGDRIAALAVIDGTDKYSLVVLQAHSSTAIMECLSLI
jgi:hypothetical protein